MMRAKCGNIWQTERMPWVCAVPSWLDKNARMDHNLLDGESQSPKCVAKRCWLKLVQFFWLSHGLQAMSQHLIQIRSRWPESRHLKQLPWAAGNPRRHPFPRIHRLVIRVNSDVVTKAYAICKSASGNDAAVFLQAPESPRWRV